MGWSPSDLDDIMMTSSGSPSPGQMSVEDRPPPCASDQPLPVPSDRPPEDAATNCAQEEKSELCMEIIILG